MRVIVPILALVALPVVAVADGLPLRGGYYVEGGVACGNASNATLSLLTLEGLAFGRDFCALPDIVAVGRNDFDIAEDCGSDMETVRWTLESNGFSRRFSTGETVSYRYCPQASLPEPWRSNDIGN